MNTTHPLLPDYTGPTAGWFTFLHHEWPVEWSDNVLERRDYVWKEKPPHEQRVRALACQVIPAALISASFEAAWTAYSTSWTACCTTWVAFNKILTTLSESETAIEAAKTAVTAAKTTLDAVRPAFDHAKTVYDMAWLCEHLPGTPWRSIYDEAADTLLFDAEIPEEVRS